ncbi:hypothetical protein BU26DRAFT_541885 [Trematosphaeria pertusa]|uniref:Heterokaryon incompatibility domain-containing protein n=1 Tax=Trematosphaeria pertusa TaxID=390896 RepID=A0A6A6IA89_9PLEO|nr:uncharacterized protein BU26DRAFT_541885 [Trematosphaeria pertusa]KAF2246968.1 hypothetical protein BU26DRAFT_541885 [Trematosphaeria pertusa]
MKNDLHLSFGDIFNHDFTAFFDQLREVQLYQASREASEKWVQRLRFLDISSIPDLERLDEQRPTKRLKRGPHGYQTMPAGRKTQLSIPIRDRKHDDGSSYLAVSWRWTEEKAELLPSGCGLRERFDYRVRRAGQKPHKSDFPDVYMERVIRFAQSKGIELIWIDKECIYQRAGDEETYPNDIQLGVQIMDVVYGDSAVALGLMTTALTQQREMNTLASLLSWSASIKKDNIRKPKLRSTMEVAEIQSLIDRILEDSRWDRAWIFQEDHLASDRMEIMIPHAKNLSKDGQYNFGSIPNELVVKLAEFKRAVTMFCMVKGEDDQWASTVLVKVKQYNVWNKESKANTIVRKRKHSLPRSRRFMSPGSRVRSNSNNSPSVNLYPTTTLSILEDICNRSLLKEQDRVAILANAAKFSTRLDISEASSLVSDKYSLSVALLALILLNGEIINNRRFMPSRKIMEYDLCSYLKDCELKYHAPTSRFQQSFIDRCRLKSPRITERGIRTQGFLFRLLPRSKKNLVRLSSRDLEHLSDLPPKWRSRNVAPGRKLSPFADEVIEILIFKLKDRYGPRCRLADYLREHLDLDRSRPPREDTKPSKRYVLDMMSAIAQALEDGQKLRLGQLIGEANYAPPSALFITPIRPDGSRSRTNEHATPPAGHEADLVWIFTTWDNGGMNRAAERFASLEVAVGVTGKAQLEWSPDGGLGLGTIGWVNGVWDVRGGRMNPFTFALPGITGSRKKK